MTKLEAIKKRLDNAIIKFFDKDVGLIWNRVNAEFILHAPEDMRLLLKLAEAALELAEWTELNMPGRENLALILAELEEEE